MKKVREERGLSAFITKKDLICFAVIMVIAVIIVCFVGCGIGADVDITEDKGALFMKDGWVEPSSRDTVAQEILFNEPPFEEVIIESENFNNSE